MKVTNQEFVEIYRALNEIVDCKEAKILLPDSGKIIYAAVKNLNSMKKPFKTLSEAEDAIKESFIKSVNKDNEKEMALIMKKELNDLFHNQEQEITVHQMDISCFDILQKYLTGPSTSALLNYLVKESA